MDISSDEFLRRFSADVLAGDAAIFAGAGLSIPAGFVDWRTLLRDIASDLNLEIDLETDLLAVAQYEYNRKRTRDSLNQAILDRFAQEGQTSQNHRLIARLPIDTIWTTNYDKIIEDTLKEANRRVDVKISIEDLAVHRRDTDTTVYKMHGDVNSPNQAILTKDDYECYETERLGFTTLLLSHLLTKRFLFIGFSFTDPNIEYTFNRLRRLLNPRVLRNEQLRDHYCLLRKPNILDVDKQITDTAERQRRHTIDLARFQHRVSDLKRYGLQTLQLDSYSEITSLLEQIQRRVSTINVMVSGAADDFGPLAAGSAQKLSEDLGRRLIEDGFNIVSGMGKGIGAELLIGAHQALGRPNSGSIGSRLRLFPFPYWHQDEEKRMRYFEANRIEMAAQAGVSIFISGNKTKGGTIVESPGVMAEFEEAKKNGHIIIPIGATGHAAQRIWQEVSANPTAFFPTLDASNELRILGDINSSTERLLEAVFNILKRGRMGGK